MSERVLLRPVASGIVGVEMVEPPDPWRGRQPKYEKLVMRAPTRFYLETKLPSGEPIAVQLGRLSFEMRLSPDAK